MCDWDNLSYIIELSRNQLTNINYFNIANQLLDNQCASLDWWGDLKNPAKEKQCTTGGYIYSMFFRKEFYIESNSTEIIKSAFGLESMSLRKVTFIVHTDVWGFKTVIKETFEILMPADVDFKKIIFDQNRFVNLLRNKSILWVTEESLHDRVHFYNFCTFWKVAFK